MSKQVIIGFLIVLGCCPTIANGQTKFKERVSISIDQKTSPDSLVKLFGQNEFSSVKGLLVKVLKTRDKEVRLELKAGQQHITEFEKVYAGEKHTLTSDSVVTRDTTLIFTIKEQYSDIAEIDSGRYVANIHSSNDTLYINFWLDVIEDSTYYDVKDPTKYEWDFLPTEKYFITLKNRQAVTLWGFNWEIAAVTLPFKLHFGNQDQPANFNTGVNLSTFIGRRYSRFNFRYDTYEKMKKTEFSFSTGLVLGISSASLDSNNTSISDLESTNSPVFSIGLGGILNLKDFNLGVFTGYDIGLSKTARKWDYHRRPWLGFGFGYKVALFGSSE